MAIDFAAGEMGGFTPTDSSALEETNTSFYDTAFARASIRTISGASYVDSPTLTSRTDVWIHFEVIEPVDTAALNGAIFYWYDSGNTARVRVTYTSSGNTFALAYWNGSTWVSAGSITLSLASRHVVDIHAVVNTASGSLVLYVAGTERINSGTIDLSGATNLNHFQLLGTTTTVARYFNWSQVIVANESTIGMRLVTLYASGAGSDSAWSSGTYASIDEAVYNDADFITSATANQVMTFAATAVATFTGYTIKAVCVTARAKKGASGPTQLQLALRVNGVNYFSASKALTTGYGAVFNVWDTDPLDSTPFTVADMTGLQFGVKSIT